MEWVTGTPLAELTLLTPQQRAARAAASQAASGAASTRSGPNHRNRASTRPSYHPGESAHGLDPGPIIEVGVRCSLAQLLEHGYYHG
jgi:predicted unusual protein kinase regulating ubiquinone biosynthesis (AarF/ABC1/UbiB family)